MNRRGWLAFCRWFALAVVWVAGSAAAAGQETAIEPIRVLTLPASLPAGAEDAASIFITNTSAEAWHANGPVRLSYHWLDGTGRPVVFDGVRTALARSVGPGESATVCATLVAPSAPGRYVLEWDLVHEGVRWLDLGAPSRRDVAVTPPEAPRPAPAAVGRATSWLLATLAHACLVAWWWPRLVGRQRRNSAVTEGPTSPSRISALSSDRAVFEWILVASGSLHAALTTVAFTLGLSLFRGIVALAALNGAAVLAAWTCPGRDDPGAVPERSTSDRITRVLEYAGLALLIALAAAWWLPGSASFAVTGTDAAHYHVPYAVAYALGHSPMSFAATPHLYPMGTSVLAAWFILPAGTPLLVDLTMVVPFLVLAASLAWLFRLVTGESGLAWTPWLVLLLFSTPLMRMMSLMSADLPFTAAVAGLMAQGLALALGVTGGWSGWLLAGLTAGVLVGTKTTGFAAMGLVAITCLPVLAWRHWRSGGPVHMGRALGLALLGVSAWFLAGGWWMARGLLNFGSPLAPMGLELFGATIFPGDALETSRNYLSVFADMANPAGYDLPARTRFFIDAWIAPHASLFALLLLAYPIDLACAWLRGRRSALTPRTLFAALLVVVTVPLVWLLVQAPWTSLEWTRGRSLRYAAPVIVLTAFACYVALFPAAARWYRSAAGIVTGGTIVVAVAVWQFLARGDTVSWVAASALPRATWVTWAIGMAVTLPYFWPRVRPRRRVARIAVALLTLAVALASGRAIAAANQRLLRVDQAARTARLARCGGEEAAPARNRHAEAARAVARRAEEGRCDHVRVFITTRFDEPLAFQTLPYRTLVFDVRERSLVPRDVAAHGPGAVPGACDFIVASAAELATTRGVPLINRVRANSARRIEAAGTTSAYELFRVR